MKKDIYQTIIDQFDQWAGDYNRACTRGCSPCCTQNVTITALEGEKILSYVRDNGLETWLAGKLGQPYSLNRPRMTTNQFAHACLNGREADPGGNDSLSICPFLEENICRIYPARPFACRCFISTVRCSARQPARISEHYISASTAMMQLIEHLGQKEYWGNMTDVLLALCDISINAKIAEQLEDPSRIMQARLQTHSARPLPGFLFTEEDEKKIQPLLAAIFTTSIDGKTVEDILNGK
ncbi:MAG: hypothetical protein Q8R88_17910 [Desulfoprunum sp.]|nr:hypothetical protein [Desulfoprunum sp.]